MKGPSLSRRLALGALATLVLAACGKRPDRLKPPVDPETESPTGDDFPRRYPTN